MSFNICGRWQPSAVLHPPDDYPARMSLHNWGAVCKAAGLMEIGVRRPAYRLKVETFKQAVKDDVPRGMSFSQFMYALYRVAELVQVEEQGVLDAVASVNAEKLIWRWGP